MKVRFLAILIFILPGIAFSQTVDINQGCAPLHANFQAPAGHAKYYWDFKDGSSSDKEKPDHYFLEPGGYDVDFSETQGGVVIGTVHITVYKKPVSVVETPIGCAPYAITMHGSTVIDPAVKIKNYTWLFGDGDKMEGQEKPVHTYLKAGKYDGSFKIETEFPSCVTTTTFSLEVLSAPVSSFTTSPTQTFTCADKLSVAFINISTGVKPLTYAWNFGNEKTSTVESPPAQAYTKGQFTVSLEVSYAGLAGCSDQTSTFVSVGGPKAEIKIANDTVCFGTLVNLRTTTAGIYAWKFGAEATPSTSSQPSPSVDFSKAGLHKISLTVSNGQCADSTTVSVYVDQVILVDSTTSSINCKSPLLVNHKVISNQAGVYYHWYFSDSTSSTASNVAKTYYSSLDTVEYAVNEPEIVPYAVTVTSKLTGCKDSLHSAIPITLPNALFAINHSGGCIPLAILFKDLSTATKEPIVKWEWNFGDGTTQTTTTSQDVTHIYSKTGNYKASLKITTQSGCTDTSYDVDIASGDDLSQDVGISADKSEVCPYEIVNFKTIASPSTLNIIDAFHFSSADNREFHCSDQNNPSWSYTDEIGPQNVSLTVIYNGCVTTIAKGGIGLVTVKGPVAKIDYSADCSNPLEYTFKDLSKGATKITWNFGDGNSSNALTDAHTYLSSGDRIITLTAENPSTGCKASVDTAVVNVRKAKAKITLDTLLCVNTDYGFSAAGSVDVDAGCYSGYTWEFPTLDRRPYTTASSLSSFSFDSGGITSIRLIAKDINGCRDTATASFKVFDLNVLTSLKDSADQDSRICLPAEVLFNDLSTGDTTITHWQWDFGDGISATDQNTKHRYVKPPAKDSYTVKLTVQDKLGCSEFINVPLGYYKPLSSVTVIGNQLCLGKAATVSASDYTLGGSNLSYFWNLGDGTTSTKQSFDVIYAEAKNYTVKMAYKEISSGCQDSLTSTIKVQSYPVPAMTSNIDTLPVLCNPQNVHFEDKSTFDPNSPVNHSNWITGNGQTFNDRTSFDLPYKKGDFTLTHIVSTSFGCSKSLMRSFKVYGPEGNFSLGKTVICKGDSITVTISKDTIDVASFTWDFNDGNTVDNISPYTHKYNFHPINGTAYPTLILHGQEGCDFVVKGSIQIRQVITDFKRNDGIDTSTCYDNSGLYPLVNTSTSIDKYFWNFGDGQTSTESNPVSHSYKTPGVYNVVLSGYNNETKCVDTIAKKIIIYKNPIVYAKGDTICQGGTAQLLVLKPDSLYKYRWLPTIGPSADTITNPQTKPEHTVLYTVTATDTNACSSSAYAPAVIIEPSGLFGLDTSIVLGDTVVLPVNVQNVYSFTWTPPIKLSCFDCNFPVVKTLEDIEYKLNIKDVRNCFPASANFKIAIKPQVFVKLPTSFTPTLNGDTPNDTIYVNGWGIKELLEFQIFNRWGQMLFVSTDIKKGWDGKYQGMVQNSDVYVYKVRVKTWKDEEIRQEGYINLLH